MQGGKNQVTGQGGLDADGGGLLVTHFTDHDHIRVGTQKGPHGRGKIESDLGFHLHLSKPRWVISTGSSAVQILVSVLLMKLKGRVQGGRFTGTGRSADEDQPIGLGDHADEVFVVGF
jgi:hypothetical protein